MILVLVGFPGSARMNTDSRVEVLTPRAQIIAYFGVIYMSSCEEELLNAEAIRSLNYFVEVGIMTLLSVILAGKAFIR